MQRKLYKKEERGLKGGPNHQVSEMMGSVTTTGYWPDSPDRNNDFNIIPSNEITMEGMDMPLMGIDNLGNTQYMTPGNNYTFPGSYVTETPVAKQGGMYLGHYTFKDGGLVRMDPGGPTKKQAAADKAHNQQQARAWDANETYGYQEEPLNYNPKTGEYTNWKGEVVRVETKPMVIGSPKGAPKKSKAQIEKEKAIKYDKQTKADPTLWLQEHPEYMLDENGNPVLRSAMQTNAPEDLNKLDIQAAKEEFVKDLNADPLQQSLGTASLDNPVTAKAAENYANYIVNNQDPRWATDKMLSGNDAPSTADFYRPHDATLGFGAPAAAVMAPIAVEGAITAAPYVAEGWKALKTAAKPTTDAWNAILNAPRFGNSALTLGNGFKTLAAYDLSHKYIPNTIEDAQMYNKTGDVKYLEDGAYNLGKGLLEIGASTGPLMSEVSAAKKPVSLIDDARKAADVDKNIENRALSGVKTFKNIMGYMREQGGGVFLGAYKQVGGQLVPYDTDMGSFQKGGEPIYVYSKDDPAYKKYLRDLEYYNKQKAIYDDSGERAAYQTYDDLVEQAYKNAEHYKEKFDPSIGLEYVHIGQPNSIGFAFRKPSPVILEKESNPEAIDIKPLPMQQVDLKSGLTRLPIPQTNKQRVVVNTPQGDKIRVQDAKTKRFINWEDEKGLPSDVENPSGTASQDFPEMRRVAVPPGGFAYGGDISVPNLSRQDGGEMPFGLPLKEQNIYTLPEYIQPINPKTGEILPDPRRPDLGMGTKASEFKYTYGTDEGDIDIPSIVAGQYIGDQALDRYRLTGERFKTMTDPGSYSNFYMQMRDLGLMQEKHGGAVKKVKIKSIPKNWKSQ